MRAFHGVSTNRSGRNTVKTRPLHLALCAAVSAILASPALAADGEHETQQSRFSTCAHESKGLRGEEHQHFMSECLKAHAGDESAYHEGGVHPTSAEASPHNRMKACNDEAGRQNLHGEERRAFMSNCLKG
jgi:hypothetical protein